MAQAGHFWSFLRLQEWTTVSIFEEGRRTPMNIQQTRRPGRVLVLYNHSSHMIKGESRDLIADQSIVACASSVTAALAEAGFQVHTLPLQGNVETALEAYPPSEWIIFNLVEGLDGRLFEEARVAWALEAMGYRFTGNAGAALATSTNKMRAKEALTAAGVPTPAYWSFSHPDEVLATLCFDFPLIVKPVAEDASQGIDNESVVHTISGLRNRVAYVRQWYRQAALVETFVSGREFNVGLWGNPPEPLPVAEIDFSAFEDSSERIVSFSAKWKPASEEYQKMPVQCPAVLTPDIEAALITTARQAWYAMGCRGYARVDMRLAESGIPYVIEVNCNPDISSDAGFYRAAKAAGYSYADMAEYILEAALRA
jgi:D-alanine-D-alanine ligase